MRKQRGWLDVLQQQGLEVRSARDALQVKGWLDTGCFALNWSISGRFQHGYPLGHTVEIFGDPSTGKSFLVARAIAMAQQYGGVALLDDTEGAYSAGWLAALGVDAVQVAYRNSRTVKEHLTTAQGFVEAFRAMRPSPPLGVLACDSLAQLTTDHELETKLDKRDMTKAGELRTFFRVIGGELLKLPVVHISANHTIANIGNPFQSRTTPGGGGLKFAATVRLDMRAVSRIKIETEYVGVICRVVVDKNRIAPPWKEVRLAIPFARPISRASGLVPLLIELGILSVQGQFLYYDGTRLGRAAQSKEKFLVQDEIGEKLLDEHPEILAEADHRLVVRDKERGTRGATAEAAVDNEEET